MFGFGGHPEPLAGPGDAPVLLSVQEAEHRVSERFASSTSCQLILVDGRSGSGKTHFTSRLLRQWPGTQVLHLDDLYPDWNGLQAGADHAAELVCSWAWGENPTYTPTVWPGTRPRPDVTLRSGRSLIVEGVGALLAWDPALSADALPSPVESTRLYFDLPAPARKERALGRDGETFAPHWDRWAAQEDALERTHNPKRYLAEFIVSELK